MEAKQAKQTMKAKQTKRTEEKIKAKDKKFNPAHRTERCGDDVIGCDCNRCKWVHKMCPRIQVEYVNKAGSKEQENETSS